MQLIKKNIPVDLDICLYLDICIWLMHKTWLQCHIPRYKYMRRYKFGSLNTNYFSEHYDAQMDDS